MKELLDCLRRLLQDEQGANGIEYAMLAGLIAIAFVAAAGTLGTKINTSMQQVATCVGDFSTCPG